MDGQRDVAGHQVPLLVQQKVDRCLGHFGNGLDNG